MHIKGFDAKVLAWGIREVDLQWRSKSDLGL